MSGARFKGVFKFLDKNNDGLLTKDEFRSRCACRLCYFPDVLQPRSCRFLLGLLLLPRGVARP